MMNSAALEDVEWAEFRAKQGNGCGDILYVSVHDTSELLFSVDAWEPLSILNHKIRCVCLERFIFVFNWETKSKVLCLDVSVLKDTESREEQDDVASYLQWVANTECWNHFVIRAYQVQQKALHGGTESTLFAQNKTKTVACLAKWLAVHNTLPVLKT